MPQEAWILKCYSCKKFQVQLKKKAKKWQCKVCGAKQDLMNIYFKGQPSDCRVNVQNLNAAEGENLEKLHNNMICEEENYYENQQENISQNFQNHNSYSFNGEIEDFSDNAMLNIDSQHKQVEEFSQNSQNHNSYSLKYEIKDFSENDILNISSQHKEIEEFSENFENDDNFHSLKCELEDFSEKAILHAERRFSHVRETSEESISVNERLNQNSELHSQSNDNSEEDPYDVNTIDFTIKTYKPPTKNVRNTESLKLSVFESNSDFDESLEF